MRSKSRMVLVALVAVFALSAVAASSALASPEWYVKKSGTYSKVKEAVKVAGTASVEEILKEEGPFKGEESGGISCTGGKAEGELKAGGISDIIRFGEFTCKPLKSCATGGVGSIKWIHLPWQVELYKEGSEIRSKLGSSGAGTPEFKWLCHWSPPVFGEEIETPFAATSAKMTNLASGFVESKFDEKSTSKTKWLHGTVEWKGSFVTVKPLEGSGVEAIKVE